MRKLTAILLIVLVVSAAGLVVFLGVIDIQAPTERMEVPIANERLSP